jgi:hypothetical protein
MRTAVISSGYRCRIRVAAGVERRDDSRPIAGRAVLAELEFVFELNDGELDPDNALQHRLYVWLGQILHPPRRGLARFVVLRWYLVLNTNKEALKAAPGFTYDKTKTTWMPAAK